jgi:eukaryotic translation initiation factor 2C
MSSGGNVDFDNTCLEAITFLAHAFREYPALKHTTIKQSIFARTQERTSLGSGIEAIKGAYQSLRVVHAGVAGLGRLSLNIDVANTAFWTESTLINAAIALTEKRDVNDLITALRQGEKGHAAVALKKMRKLHVVAKPRGGREDKYVIDKFVYKSARNETFEKDGKMTSIYDYYAKEYSIRLQHDGLPLVKMTRGKNTLVPMELLKLEPYQKYNYKLNERQTTAMLKFAVTTPPKRATDIQEMGEWRLNDM